MTYAEMAQEQARAKGVNQHTAQAGTSDKAFCELTRPADRSLTSSTMALVWVDRFLNACMNLLQDDTIRKGIDGKGKKSNDVTVQDP